jgi:hypothetical protein
VTVQRRTVEAQNLVLKDPDGHPRILLSAGADGPLLALLDENATPRAMISCQTGPMISLIDSAARGRLILASGIGESEAPMFSLRSADGDARVHAQVLDNEEGGLEVSGVTRKLFATPSSIGFRTTRTTWGQHFRFRRTRRSSCARRATHCST